MDSDWLMKLVHKLVGRRVSCSYESGHHFKWRDS
jgi:hypothetical protein